MQLICHESLEPTFPACQTHVLPKKSHLSYRPNGLCPCQTHCAASSNLPLVVLSSPCSATRPSHSLRGSEVSPWIRGRQIEMDDGEGGGKGRPKCGAPESGCHRYDLRPITHPLQKALLTIGKGSLVSVNHAKAIITSRSVTEGGGTLRQPTLFKTDEQLQLLLTDPSHIHHIHHIHRLSCFVEIQS